MDRRALPAVNPCVHRAPNAVSSAGNRARRTCESYRGVEQDLRAFLAQERKDVVVRRASMAEGKFEIEVGGQ